MPKKKTFYEEAKKWFNYAIGFDSEESRAEFKSYVHNRKLKDGTPIYQTVKEMMELHKEKYKR